MAKILVVDDEPAIRSLFLQMLRALGHEALAAENGEGALRVLSQDEFDCVITDLAMPIMGGVDLINEIRSRGSEIPVLVVTGSSFAAHHQLKLAHGAQMYLDKPVTLLQLEEALACLI